MFDETFQWWNPQYFTPLYCVRGEMVKPLNILPHFIVLYRLDGEYSYILPHLIVLRVKWWKLKHLLHFIVLQVSWWKLIHVAPFYCVTGQMVKPHTFCPTLQVTWWNGVLQVRWWKLVYFLQLYCVTCQMVKTHTFCPTLLCYKSVGETNKVKPTSERNSPNLP